MKNIIYMFFLIPFMFSSCEKVIDLKLEGKEEKYVIEGKIINKEGVVSNVFISKTKNFSDNNDFNGVSGAVVKIENNGVAISLPETSKGVYSTSAIKGTPGQTYKLSVSVDGHLFTASSTMPEPVPLNDFTLKPNGFDSLRTVTYARFKDPLEIKNYYWFELFINDKRQRNFSLMNDDFTTGNDVTTTIVFENNTDDLSKNIKKGDKLGIEMHSIDPSVYLYLLSLSGADGSGNGAAPSNPISNINGGALGFFSAHTTQSKTLVIP